MGLPGAEIGMWPDRKKAAALLVLLRVFGG